MAIVGEVQAHREGPPEWLASWSPPMLYHEDSLLRQTAHAAPWRLMQRQRDRARAVIIPALVIWTCGRERRRTLRPASPGLCRHRVRS